MIQKMWSGKNKLYWFLTPLSLVFAIIVFVRRRCYQIGLFKSSKASVPIIVVGNLSVGGNGKTPLVIYLINLLRENGYRVGVVARGYGGKAETYPVIVTKQTSAKEVGDEPMLVYERTNVPFAVAPKRIDAVNALLKNVELDIIITDDGLQHYALQRDIELVVVDHNRKFGNGFLLPAGPMRESKLRLKTVDFVIYNGKQFQKESNTYSMILKPTFAINLLTKEQKKVNELNNVCAMAGIGDPNRFFETLKHEQVNVIKKVPFLDHQPYTKEMLQALTNGDQILLMTEKDAVKCKSFAEKNWWYLPVDADLDADFSRDLIQKIKKIQQRKPNEAKIT